MALKIRLSRGGKKKQPHYSIVVTEASERRDASCYKAKIGHYHPTLAKETNNRIVISKDEFVFWVERGAKPTECVVRLMKLVGMGDVVQKFEKVATPSKYAGLSKKQKAQAVKKEAEDAKLAKEAKAKAKAEAEAQAQAKKELEVKADEGSSDVA